MDTTTTPKYTITYEETFSKIQELRLNKTRLVLESLNDISEKILLQSNLCMEPLPFTSEAAQVEFAQAKSVMIKRLSKLLNLLKKKWNRRITNSEKMNIFFDLVR